jgi:hypothetical protein
MSTRARRPLRRAAESRSPGIFPLCSRVLPPPTVPPWPGWVGTGGSVVGTAAATILAMSRAIAKGGAPSALVSGSCPSLAGCRENVARRSRKGRAGAVPRPKPCRATFARPICDPRVAGSSHESGTRKALENLSENTRPGSPAGESIPRVFREAVAAGLGRHALSPDRCPRWGGSGRNLPPTFPPPSAVFTGIPVPRVPRRRHPGGTGATRRRNRRGTGPTHRALVPLAPARGRRQAAEGARKVRGRCAEDGPAGTRKVRGRCHAQDHTDGEGARWARRGG